MTAEPSRPIRNDRTGCRACERRGRDADLGAPAFEVGRKVHEEEPLGSRRAICRRSAQDSAMSRFLQLAQSDEPRLSIS